MTGPAVRSTLFNIAFLLAAVAPRAAAQRGWADFGRRFDAFAEAAGVVGGSAVLVRKGAILGRHHYGLADRASQRTVTDRTIYHWASVTKTLTAIAVLQLRDRGLLSLDGSRYGYFNPGYIYLARVIEQLTGDPWAVYVQKNLWTPLGMDRSYVGATPYHLAADRSHGYRVEGDSLTDVGADFDSGITIPNGGWRWRSFPGWR